MLTLTALASMTNTDIQLLVAQARSEADNPAFKVWRPIHVSRCAAALSQRRDSRNGGVGLAANSPSELHRLISQCKMPSPCSQIVRFAVASLTTRIQVRLHRSEARE